MSDLPETMRVVEISEFGGPEVLKPGTRPVPTPGAGEILIRVAAAGVNRPDALQRMGNYPVPPGASDLPGLEAAGTVAAVGEGVGRWKVGDKVCALLPGGGYAEYAVTPADHALPVPEGMSMEAAACLPETVFTTVGNAEKAEFCRGLGAEAAINYREQDYVEEVKALTDGRGVDVILDMVGGDYINRDIKALADDGRLSFIAFLGGPKAEVNFAQVMIRRLTITGSTLRPRSIAFKAETAREIEAEVWPLVAAGRLAPVIHSRFPLEEASKAHALMESSAHMGKIVLTL